MTDENPSKKSKTIDSLSNAETTTIVFSKDYASENYKLIEVPQDILDAINQKDQLYLKGAIENADAVLCTNNKTFALKKAETSNSVFLLPPSNTNGEFAIASKSSEYYEVAFNNSILLI